MKRENVKVGKGFPDAEERLRIVARGAVQGVGFRPFVYRLARSLNLNGWARNFPGGVQIELEGSKENLRDFFVRIEREKPPHSFIQSLESYFFDPAGYSGFEILESESSGEKTTLVLPDVATCQDCLGDLFDSKNRRYLYPFTNCTHCGPRFTIIEALPYDRSRTSMKKFPMCADCRAEYAAPEDRRFHAEPNACPKCGPRLELWNGEGEVLARYGEALDAAVLAIRKGDIVALKGLGGFQLIADARNSSSVRRLRNSKQRDEKPFALMFPSLSFVKRECEVSGLEKRMLLSPEAPIVIVRRKQNVPVISYVCPETALGNPYVGAMLPYTPLHHILMQKLGFPVVATSGNLSEECLCIDEYDALERLGGIADLLLVHNRPIVRHADDSIVRMMGGRELVLRRARGFAPLPVSVPVSDKVVLSVGAHMKNTISLTQGENIFLSPHIGNLESAQTLGVFKKAIDDYQSLYEARPCAVACDLHPDYLSTRFAEDCGFPVIQVQHHYAHVLACMAENELEAPVLGVAWDGTGLGLDGTIWGGEFLKINEHSFERTAHFRCFPLPGGDAAVRDVRRSAIGVLYEAFGSDIFKMQNILLLKNFVPSDIRPFQRMLEHRVNSPLTSSAGRLFDAVSAITGLCRSAAYEGHAAMTLEFAITDTEKSYAFDVREQPESQERWLVDWESMLKEILKDLHAYVPAGVISGKFHNTLAEIIVRVAKLAGEERVVLTGGCFQNKYLTERAIRRLRQDGFRPYWHQRIPPNDGGIAVGQSVAARRLLHYPASLKGSELCA